MLLDENLLLADPAAAGSYAELGVREISPDGRYLAYSVDFDGDEVYQLRIRDLAAGTDLAERDRADLLRAGLGRGLPGAALRGHRRGVPAARDLAARARHRARPRHAGVPGGRRAVRADRPGHPQRSLAADRDGVPRHHRDPADPGRGQPRDPVVAKPRRPGTEYYADHADGPGGGELYLVTNAGAAEFRLVRAPVTAPGPAAWTEVIGPAADTRLVRCDVFGRYLVVEQRRGAQTQLRVVDRETGAQRLIEAGGPEQALALAVNEEYTASHGDRAHGVADRAAVLA